jgi:disease resistance protein RPM1
VIRQWIAEGFVKEENGKTLEEVAEGYLTELIHRSLVQVSLIGNDGKAERCCVHDQIREMILEKFEDLNFCTQISEDGKSSLSGIVRRLSIATTFINLPPCIESSHVRSLLFFADQSSIIFGNRIPKYYKLLTVLDCESHFLSGVLENLENFIHLKYLSLGFSDLEFKTLKSISMLRNLETLMVEANLELPKEFSKLRKLRHLIGGRVSLIQLEDGIGEMTSLQTLYNVDLDTDVAGKIIKGFEKLKQMRFLALRNVRREDVIILSSSINEMQHLEMLNIESRGFEVIDLDLISLPTKLRKLGLCGILQKLPEWIPKLQNLVQLTLSHSQLPENSLKSLNCLQHLLSLSIEYSAYDGLCLHFEDGWFQKLKELNVVECHKFVEVIIDKGALPSLKKLHLHALLGLESIPTDIQHLEKLEVLRISYMSDVCVQNISTEDWNLMQHVPLVHISNINGDSIPNPRS